MQIEFKYNIGDYVEIKPLEGFKGRIVSCLFDGQISYKVEFWSNMEQKYCYLLEDEIK
jgi:hypothetical protein